MSSSPSQPCSDSRDEARVSASQRRDFVTYDAPTMNSQNPADTEKLVNSTVRLIHFVLGCTLLVPWNVMITALPFFQSRVAGSLYQDTLSSYLSISYLTSQFVFLAHATAFSKSFSPSHQMHVHTISLFVLTLFLTLSTFVSTTPETFFIFVITTALIMAANVSYLTSSVFAVAAMFGPTAIQAVVSGEAAIAVAVNLVQTASVAISLSQRPHDAGLELRVNLPGGRSPEEESAFVFFMFATCFLGMSVVAHNWLVKMRGYKVLVAQLERKIMMVEAEADAETMTMVGERRPLLGSCSPPAETEETSKERILRVARANIKYEFSVAYVYLVTLAVFPPITTAIMPTNPGFHPLLFSAIHFLLFNIGDLVGRQLHNLYPPLLVSSPNSLVFLSLSHTLFVPLFLACNIRLPSSPSTITPLINSDALFFLILVGFGMSNGYTSSLCLMVGPSLEHNARLRGKEDVDTAATIGVFCLVGGLMVGSFASFGIRAIVCGCNPFIG